MSGKIRAIRNKVRAFNYKFRHDFLTMENIVLMLAIVLCFVWTYQSITAMSRNMELSRKLSTEKKALKLLELEAETKELENEYYKTSEYQELAARKSLDMQFSGEMMVVMPENSEGAKNKHKVAMSGVEEEEEGGSNFDEWMMYLFPKY